MPGLEAFYFQELLGLLLEALAGGMAVGGIMAYEFERHIWKKILEVVKKDSQAQPTIESIDHYHQ
jgi:hypothetical protein